MKLDFSRMSAVYGTFGPTNASWWVPLGAFLNVEGCVEGVLYKLLFHQFVHLEAEKSAPRIKRSVKLFEGDVTGHLSILKTVSINPLVINNGDWMKKKYNFNRLFRVSHPDRDAWECGGLERPAGLIVSYTDGSRTNDQVEVEVTGLEINMCIPMSKWQTLFQAEIQECCTVCLRRNYL